MVFHDGLQICLFEPFYQILKVNKNKGLGLSIGSGSLVLQTFKAAMP
jgi:hypothetical protein